MLAPMLVQMERQIDREIAAEQRLQQSGQDQTQQDESDSDLEDEQPVLMYGPQPQIVTNDLKSLDEMVRRKSAFFKKIDNNNGTRIKFPFSSKSPFTLEVE